MHINVRQINNLTDNLKGGVTHDLKILELAGLWIAHAF